MAKVDPIAALWEAPYFAAMAFTNTGFAPNDGGVAVFADDYLVLFLLMVGVFLGSIGFPVIYTLAKHVWHVKRWSLHTKLTLVTTVLLFILGAAVFVVLEFNNPKTFGSMDAADTTFQAFFLSAMTRSGGFNVIEMDDLNGSSLLGRQHADVRRRRLRLDRRRHQGHHSGRARDRRLVRGQGPPVGRGLRPPHPQRRAARGTQRRRVGRDHRRALDHHDLPDHEG